MNRTCWYPASLVPLEACGDTAVFSVLRHEQQSVWTAMDSRECCRMHLAATIEAVDAEDPGYVVHVNVIESTAKRALDDVIRAGLAAAERGETEDLGSFARYAQEPLTLSDDDSEAEAEAAEQRAQFCGPVYPLGD